MKPLFLCLVGLPCSGKTTFASYWEDRGYLALSSDVLIETFAAEVDQTYSEAFKALIDPATKRCEADLTMASYCRENIIYDRTNLSAKSRKRALNLLHNAEDYVKYAIVFDTPIDEINKRLTVRNKTGKVITEKIMEDLQRNYSKPTVDEGFDFVMSPEAFRLVATSPKGAFNGT